MNHTDDEERFLRAMCEGVFHLSEIDGSCRESFVAWLMDVVRRIGTDCEEPSDSHVVDMALSILHHVLRHGNMDDMARARACIDGITGYMTGGYD